MPDHDGGIADRNRVVWNVTGDTRICAYDTVLADAHVGQNHRAESKKRSLPDLDEGFLVKDTLSNWTKVMNICVGMRYIHDRAVPRDTDVVSDMDTRVADDVNVLLYVHVAADAQFGYSRWLVYDGIETHPVIDANPVSKMNEASVIKRDRLDDDAACPHGTEHVTIEETRLNMKISEFEKAPLLKRGHPPELSQASHYRPRILCTVMVPVGRCML
jgi:hypothetical protein